MKNKILNDKISIFYVFQIMILITIPYIISQKLDINNNFLKGDCFYYRAIAISILEDGDLILNNNIPAWHYFDSQLALGKNGDFVPKHSIFMPLISVPFYFLFKNEGLLLFNIINCFILFFLIYIINREFHGPIISLITTILYFPCSQFLSYTYNYSPDIFSSVFLILSLYFLLKNNFYLSTVILGLSIFAKTTNLIFFPLFFTYILFCVYFNNLYFNLKKIKLAINLILLFLLSLSPIFYTNFVLFGSPFESSYENTVVSKNHQNNIIIGKHSNKFNQPFFKGINNLLFHPVNGIILTNPILIFSLIGILIIFIRNKISHRIMILFLFSALQIIFFSKYDFWQASHFSNRFLIPLIAVSSIFTGYFLDYLLSRYQKVDSSNYLG